MKGKLFLARVVPSLSPGQILWDITMQRSTQVKDRLSAANAKKHFLIKDSWRYIKELIQERSPSVAPIVENVSAKPNINIHMKESILVKSHIRAQNVKKAYHESSALRSHIITHEQIKLHKCEPCDLSFVRLISLNGHNLTHHEIEKNIACPQCDKKYKRKSDLRTHMRGIHTKETPYKCKFCEKSFHYSNSLASHIGIHTSKNVRNKE